MRISCEDLESRMVAREFCGSHSIYFDGQDVTNRCRIADDETGEVKLVVIDEEKTRAAKERQAAAGKKGLLYVVTPAPDGKPMYEYLNGKVEFRPKITDWTAYAYQRAQVHSRLVAIRVKAELAIEALEGQEPDAAERVKALSEAIYQRG